MPSEPLYLKQIADALKVLSVKDDGASKSTKDALLTIASKIERSNVINVETSAGGKTNITALTNSLHDALTYNVQEGGATVQKGIAQLVAELTTVMAGVKEALDGTTASGVGAKVGAIATNTGTIGTNTGNIRTDTNTVATNLTAMKTHTSTMATNSANWGSGGGGGSVDLTYVEMYLNQIASALRGTDMQENGMIEKLRRLIAAISNGDSNIAAAITRKLATPEAAIVVEGTVSASTMVFTPSSGQPSFAQAAGAFRMGQLVMLHYYFDGIEMSDMVTFICGTTTDQTLKTQGGYHWTQSGSSPSVTIRGSLDTATYYFSPENGQQTYTDCKNMFLHGIPIYLKKAGGYPSAVSIYNEDTEYLMTQDNWIWRG